MEKSSASPRIVEPSVEVIAFTQVPHDVAKRWRDFHVKSFLGPFSDSERLAEYAGRNCYQSWHNPAGRTNGEYIGNIVQQKHFSVLEHGSITFDIKGVSRAFTHELIRHRHLSFSQLSQRFVDGADLAFVCPPLYRSNPQLVKEWYDSLADPIERYKRLVWWSQEKFPEKSRKEIREAARSVLPNCAETQIVVTGNLRAWRDYLEKRWSSHADAEIREVSELIANHLKSLYPSAMKDISYGDS